MISHRSLKPTNWIIVIQTMLQVRSLWLQSGERNVCVLLRDVSSPLQAFLIDLLGMPTLCTALCKVSVGPRPSWPATSRWTCSIYVLLKPLAEVANCLAGWWLDISRCSDSLSAGRFGVQNPVEANFPHCPDQTWTHSVTSTMGTGYWGK
jgi:hypothetical protein